MCFYVIVINNNCKSPTDCKVRKPAVRLGRTANSGSWHNWDLTEVDTADSPADSHPGHRTVHLGIVAVTGRVRLGHCYTDMTASPWMARVARLIDRFWLSSEAKSRCNTHAWQENLFFYRRKFQRILKGKYICNVQLSHVVNIKYKNYIISCLTFERNLLMC